MSTESSQYLPPTAWEPLDDAERAVAAVHGLCCILTPVGERNSLLRNVLQSIRETLDLIREEARRLDGKELRAYCAGRVAEMRSWCLNVLAASDHPLLKLSDPDRIFTIFRDYWSTTAMQLRAPIAVDHECFDLSALGALLGLSSDDLRCLPLSSELILGLSPRGLSCDLEIPARTFVLDAILQLQLARRCHIKLARWAALRNEDTSEPLLERVHLDGFIRQVLIIGVTAIEATLADYGQLVAAFAARNNPEADVAAVTKGGVTTRLRQFARAWPPVFGREPGELPEPASDMLVLVQLRNRLVHHDGRVSAWHAVQLDLSWIVRNYGLSSRVRSYQNPTGYGMDHTHIGMEYGLGVFALDTIIETIDAIHAAVYPEQYKAGWLRIPRAKDGSLAIDRVANWEP